MTQEEWCLFQLSKGVELTPMLALEGCGCFRLSERIRRLKLKGHVIDNVQEERGTVYAVYVLREALDA